MVKYVKKPIEVDVRQCLESEVVLTAHGRVRAEPGDWVLKDSNTGDTWPIKPDIFKNTYVLVRDNGTIDIMDFATGTPLEGQVSQLFNQVKKLEEENKGLKECLDHKEEQMRLHG